MKIRVEGCTAEQLADHSKYLSLANEYEVIRSPSKVVVHFVSDHGTEVHAMLDSPFQCPHLPKGAKWVEVK